MSPNIRDTIDRWMLTRLDPGRQQSLRRSLEWRARRASVWGSPYQTAAFSDQIGTTSSSAQMFGVDHFSAKKMCESYIHFRNNHTFRRHCIGWEKDHDEFEANSHLRLSHGGVKAGVSWSWRKPGEKVLGSLSRRSSRRSDWLAFWEPPCPNCRSFLCV